MSRRITLTDADGAIVSVLEIPEHASEAARERIVSGAASLAEARGFRLEWIEPPILWRNGRAYHTESAYLAHVRAAALSPRGFLPALES